MSAPQQHSTNMLPSAGRASLNDSEGHASQHRAMSLKEKMLRAANLVAADATRQSSPKAMAKACGLTDSGPSSAPYDDEGETYLLIRQAFCAAFDELIKQTQGSMQSMVEELWAALADYVDRMHARQDVAFNDATVQFAITAELERQLRLANARYKELQHELDHMKVQMAKSGQRNLPEKGGEHAEPAKSAGDVTPEECPVPIPQPAQDRSVLGLVQHQVPLTPTAGQATTPITPADAKRSQRSTALMRLANEGILVDTSLPQTLALALAGPSLNAGKAAEEVHMTAQQQSALEEARAEAVQQGILKAERERSMARQRGIQHQLQEQLDSMHRRTACIDSPVQLSGADSASANPVGSLSQAGSGLLPASHSGLQETPHQSGFPVRKVAAGPRSPAELAPQTQRMQHPVVQSSTSATYRPRSIAQKAGMNVWSRHGSRYGHTSQQGQRESSIPGPEDVPILDASPGPLAQGLAAAAAKERHSLVGMRKPRHMRLSTSIDTVLGDVFAETTSASETIAAEPHQGLMTFVRGSPGEAATASALAQSAARWPLRPEQVALALAEQPSAQPLVSEDILSPLASPAGGQAPSMRSRADVSVPPGTRQRPAADISIAAARPLRSPPAAASPMQLARASIQQWGKPRGSQSPAAEKMVICGPTWSFPVEVGSPTKSSSRQPSAELQPAHLGGIPSPAAPLGSFRSAVDEQRSEAPTGIVRMPDLAVHPEERSISFRCRQVTASLPDMAALQAAIRGQPRAERAESRLLPDVAVAERANTLQTMQAAAEQVSASCAPDLQAPDQANQQAPWPLKKGAWDRMQQGVKSVKPDRWHANEAAAISEPIDLQAALTVQPKQASFEKAADAALAAVADARTERMSTASAVATRIIKQEALSASASSAEQGKQPPPVVQNVPSTSTAAAPSPKAANIQNGLGVSKPAEAQQVQPATPAAMDAAAASKATAKPQGVAQRLLARANCFAALAQSPTKESRHIEPLPAASKAADAPAPAASSDIGDCPEGTTADQTAKEGGSSAQKSSATKPALTATALELEAQHPAASAAASPAQITEPSPPQAAKEKDPALAASRPNELSSVRSSFTAVTHRRRATLFGESASEITPQPASAEASQPEQPSSAKLILHSSEGSGSSVAQAVTAATSGMIYGSISCAERSPSRSKLSIAKSRSLSPAGKQPHAVTQAAPATTIAQEALPPLAPKGTSVSSQVSPVAMYGSVSDSSSKPPVQEKSHSAKSLGQGQQQPSSFSIHASCQATSVTVASAAIDAAAAPEQPFQRTSPSKASHAAALAMLWPGQESCDTPSSMTRSPEKHTLSATRTPDPAGRAGDKGSPEKDASRKPVQVYAASVDSAQKAAKAAADRLTCLPASPLVAAAAEEVAAGEESRSVSDIQFSSDSDADETQSSSAAGRGHTEDSEWGGSSLLTTGEQAAQVDAPEAESAGTTRPSSAEEMYTAHSEAFQTAASEASLAALQEASLAAQVEKSISESTEVLLQTGSDAEMMHAELEVTCAQVIGSAAAGPSLAESTTEDRELDAMLASVLGTGSGQPSAQAAQEAAPAASAAEGQHEQQPVGSKPATESALGDAEDMSAFHLPDSLFGSPVAGAAQKAATCANKEANSDSEDDDSFLKKPTKKNRKGRRAGRK